MGGGKLHHCLKCFSKNLRFGICLDCGWKSERARKQSRLNKNLFLLLLFFCVVPCVLGASFDVNVSGVPFSSVFTSKVVGCVNCTFNVSFGTWLSSNETSPVFLNGTNSTNITFSVDVLGNVTNGTYVRYLNYSFSNSSFDYYDVVNFNISEIYTVKYNVTVNGNVITYSLSKDDGALPFSINKAVPFVNVEKDFVLNLSYDSWLSGTPNISMFANGSNGFIVSVAVPENVDAGVYEKHVTFHYPSDIDFNLDEIVFVFDIVEKSEWERFTHVPNIALFNLWKDNESGDVYVYKNRTMVVNNTEYITVMQFSNKTFEKIMDEMETAQIVKAQNDFVREIEKALGDLQEENYNLRKQNRTNAQVVKKAVVTTFWVTIVVELLVVGGIYGVVILKRLKESKGDIR